MAQISEVSKTSEIFDELFGMDMKMDRRSFLKMLWVGAGSALLAACQRIVGQPTITPALADNACPISIACCSYPFCYSSAGSNGDFCSYFDSYFYCHRYTHFHSYAYPN